MTRLFDALVLTCEHATNYVPPALRPLFKGQRALLASHRGWDPGALYVAQRLQKAFKVPLVASKLTRLVLDHNRSLDHPRLSWGPMRELPEPELTALIRRYYQPYRDEATRCIERALRRHRRVLHFSLHSFTPVLDGTVRSAELGLLYDPQHRLETRFALAMRPLLASNPYGWRVKRNYPYAGWTDAFTTSLRRRFPKAGYAGVELEINQKLAASRSDLRRVAELVEAALRRLVIAS